MSADIAASSAPVSDGLNGLNRQAARLDANGEKAAEKHSREKPSAGVGAAQLHQERATPRLPDLDILKLQKVEDKEEQDKEILTSDLEEKDTNVVMAQSKASRYRAVRHLKDNDNDTVDTILSITHPLEK